MHSNKDARKVSVKILTNVLLKERKLKNEFEYFAKEINQKNVNFLKNLVYGVIRFKESLDHTILKYYQKSFTKLNEKSKNILRIGLYQIDKMDSIPNYATVSTTVELAKSESISFSRVVNAILMNYIRESDSIDFSMINHPKKIISQWQKDYSAEEIESLCRWNNTTSKIWFRLNDEVKKTLTLDNMNNFHYHSDIKNYITFDDTKSAIEKYVKKNLLIVQSPSSSLVCDMLNVCKDEIVIDACASPGGKARCILENIDNSNVFHMNDISSKKYLQLNNDFKNTVSSITCKDASHEKFPLADKILLDVPCSATGTIQKNPDIKWKKHDLEKLNILQLKILKNMSKFIKDKGVIVYSTCSINKCENFKIIDMFLNENKDFAIDDASNFIDKKYVLNKCLSIFPPKHNLEGMFAARLVKL